MTRLPTATVNDDSLRRSIGISGALHFLGLLLLYFGMPVFMKPLPAPYVPVPLEIVDIADLTNTRIKDKEEPPKPPEPQPKPEEKTVQQFQPPQPPTPPQPQTKPQPEPPKAEQAEVLVPKPTEKPPPPKPVVQPPQPDLASVLKNVKKLQPAEKVKAPDAKVPAKTQVQPKSQAPSLSDRLTMSEEDALRRQIENCWSPPVGARDAAKLVVDLAIVVNPDRTVQSVEIVDKGRELSDPYFRAAAESARRAVLNPQCSPLALPEDKYEQWKNITFTFDPRDLL